VLRAECRVGSRFTRDKAQQGGIQIKPQKAPNITLGAE
jgi:hypothetical protein